MEEKRMYWQIQYGLTDSDCNRVDVICSEEELPTICGALVRYDEAIRKRPIACVARKGSGVTANDWDYMYCDCM